ncbi:MAG: hypothetical protein JO264_04960 [Acidisphaera sp.]|nr:hypothetical protein [Acidisphaera sp.]
MKITLLASSVFLTAAAHAAVFRPPAAPLCAARPAATRAAYLVADDGNLRCPQYLATTTIARGRRNLHT